MKLPEIFRKCSERKWQTFGWIWNSLKKMLRTFVQTRYYFKYSTYIFIFIYIITRFTLFFSYYFSLQDFFFKVMASIWRYISFFFYLNLSTFRFLRYSVNNSFTPYRWLSFFSRHLFIRLDLSAGIF